MHLFRAMADCHSRLLASAEALRVGLDNESVSPKLLSLRLEMAIAARDNLLATQRLWSLLEQEIPDIGKRIENYDYLKSAERDLHIKYANHIATWPATAISTDFKAFGREKRKFLEDLCRHIRALDVELFEPACRMLKSTYGYGARAA